jgi:hypothetical protein
MCIGKERVMSRVNRIVGEETLFLLLLSMVALDFEMWCTSLSLGIWASVVAGVSSLEGEHDGPTP